MSKEHQVQRPGIARVCGHQQVGGGPGFFRLRGLASHVWGGCISSGLGGEEVWEQESGGGWVCRRRVAPPHPEGSR